MDCPDIVKALGDHIHDIETLSNYSMVNKVAASAYSVQVKNLKDQMVMFAMCTDGYEEEVKEVKEAIRLLQQGSKGRIIMTETIEAFLDSPCSQVYKHGFKAVFGDMDRLQQLYNCLTESSKHVNRFGGNWPACRTTQHIGTTPIMQHLLDSFLNDHSKLAGLDERCPAVVKKRTIQEFCELPEYQKFQLLDFHFLTKFAKEETKIADQVAEVLNMRIELPMHFNELQAHKLPDFVYFCRARVNMTEHMKKGAHHSVDLVTLSREDWQDNLSMVDLLWVSCRQDWSPLKEALKCFPAFLLAILYIGSSGYLNLK